RAANRRFDIAAVAARNARAPGSSYAVPVIRCHGLQPAVSERLIGAEPGQIRPPLIGKREAAVRRRHPDALWRHFDQRAVAILALLKRALGARAFADVTEDQHDAGHLAGAVANRRAAVVDWHFGPVPAHEQRMVGEPDDQPVLQDLGHGTPDRLARLLVDDSEDALKRPPDRVIVPPGE